MKITFSTQDINMPAFEEQIVQQWLPAVAAYWGKTIKTLNYIFCSDERILQVNKEFLSHDYYTDVITFDYSVGNMIAGDIFISLDTVESNAQQLGVDFDDELMRILVHGLLHLTGQGDKTPETKMQMTAKENAALKILSDYKKQ